jgi:hypothetical protein
MLLPILLILFLGIRSSLGHRPVNISDALYSTNRVINEITKNSLHSLGYAYYSNKKTENNIAKYGKIDIKEAYKLVSSAIGVEYKDEKRPFYREVKSKLDSKKQNLSFRDINTIKLLYSINPETLSSKETKALFGDDKSRLNKKLQEAGKDSPNNTLPSSSISAQLI